MSKTAVVSSLTLSLLAGCASVPMENEEKSAEVKKFIAPNNGNSGVYVYRSAGLGTALKKDIWIDGKCVGETAPKMFFYEEVKGDSEHKISTESEFSPNDLLLTTSAGMNYFVRQYIKMGVFVGGAGLELVNDDEGKSEVSELGMAKNGICSE
ncbi:MAG: DUF2846 domain-containing protein [Porticoccaceae bacterium]